MADDTKAGTWSLTPVGSVHPATETMLLPSQKREGTGETESAFEPDNRTPVAAIHFAPGGKYRCIVKLQMRYEKQTAGDDRYAMGTGWLVRPDLLVTAGHCVYDWSQDGGLGRAVSVKAWIGYNGKKSINTSTVQFRQGIQIVAPTGWLSSPDNRTNDVSFIKLDKAFADPQTTPLTPFKFAQTPSTGQDTLGVVGYPGDKALESESGAQMYEESGIVKFDITKSDQHMLNYRISTYAGQSGSPVLRQEDGVSIGAHVYGGTKQNSASPIMTEFGNPYKDLIAIFDKKQQVSAKAIQYVPLVHTEDTLVDGSEGFWDTFKNVVKTTIPIASTVLSVATPFMGPLGAPVAAVAGTALGLAGKLTESSMQESSMQGDSISTSGIAERAVLAEAALQTVLKMDSDVAQESGIFDTMKSVYAKLGPVVTGFAPKLIPAVVTPALQLAMKQIQQSQAAPATESAMETPTSFWVPPPPSFKAIKLDAETQGFADTVSAASTRGADGAESIWGSIVSAGLKALPVIVPALGSLLGGTESDMEPSPSEAAIMHSFHRAAMGEAALQALIKHHSESHEEGFFGDLLNTVKTVGNQVLRVAPSVIQTAAPIVLNILKSSAASSGGAAPTESIIVGGKPGKDGLKHKPSVAEWLNSGLDGTSPSAEHADSALHDRFLPTHANKAKARVKKGVQFLTPSERDHLSMATPMASPMVHETGAEQTSVSETKPREDAAPAQSMSLTASQPEQQQEGPGDSGSGGNPSRSLSEEADVPGVPDKSAPPGVSQREPNRDGLMFLSGGGN